MHTINIILDAKDPQNPTFVEIENDNGKSIRIGAYVKNPKGDGFDAICISSSDIEDHPDTQSTHGD